MYHCKYRCCGCQGQFHNDLLENICDHVPATAQCSNPKDQCQCGFEEEWSPFPANPMLAQSYVPVQIINKIFTPCVGLKMGTIFPELVSPYVPCQSMEEIAYIKATNEIGEGCNKC